MPIYQYRCEACGHELEALQKVGEVPLTRCPKCGAERLRKQLTAAGFRLKGNGWYETDFKKKPKKEPSPDKAKAKPEAGGSPTSKSGSGAKASGGDASPAGASDG